MIDAIDGNTYVFEPQQGGDENNLARGAWDWNFDWKRIPLNAREKALRKTVTEPFRSPGMNLHLAWIINSMQRLSHGGRSLRHIA